MEYISNHPKLKISGLNITVLFSSSSCVLTLRAPLSRVVWCWSGLDSLLNPGLNSLLESLLSHWVWLIYGGLIWTCWDEWGISSKMEPSLHSFYVSACPMFVIVLLAKAASPHGFSGEKSGLLLGRVNFKNASSQGKKWRLCFFPVYHKKPLPILWFTCLLLVSTSFMFISPFPPCFPFFSPSKVYRAPNIFHVKGIQQKTRFDSSCHKGLVKDLTAYDTIEFKGLFFFSF